jgi:hypothetical protein
MSITMGRGRSLLERGLANHRRELCRDQDLRLGVVEDVGDRAGVEPVLSALSTPPAIGTPKCAS